MTLSPAFVASQVRFENWYDSKSEDYREFIDTIADRTYYIIDENEYDAFIDELKSHGIEDADQFEDKFRGEFEGDSDSVLYEFAEQFCESALIYPFCFNGMLSGYVDWEAVWNCELRFDYTVLTFKGNTYIFANY